MRAILAAILLFVAIGRAQAAEDLILRVAAAPNGVHGYYHALLLDALAGQGISAKLEVQPSMPQPRLEAALREGSVHVHYFLRTAARDRDFIPIAIGLTDGLIANRILLIRDSDAERFADVGTLEEFRRKGMVAGFGQNWFDTTVWHANRLPYREVGGDYRRIFSMLAHGNREIDYFPRGMTEILAEVDTRANLAVEPHLLFRYANDHVFYLSPSMAHLQPALEAALRQLADEGVIRQRAQAYWATTVAALKIDQRRVIDLEMPTSTD